MLYKNVPITRFSSDEYGFTDGDISIFKSALMQKTQSDELFVKELLRDQPISKTNALVNTFPEFLSSEYNRTCGKAYEALKNTMKLGIPTDEPLAFGIGTSSSDEHGRLYSNISLIVDGIDITISKIE